MNMIWAPACSVNSASMRVRTVPSVLIRNLKCSVSDRSKLVLTLNKK